MVVKILSKVSYTWWSGEYVPKSSPKNVKFFINVMFAQVNLCKKEAISELESTDKLQGENSNIT